MSSNTGKGVNSKLDDCLGYILQSSRGYDMRLEVNSRPLMHLTSPRWARLRHMRLGLNRSNFNTPHKSGDVSNCHTLHQYVNHKLQPQTNPESIPQL